MKVIHIFFSCTLLSVSSVSFSQNFNPIWKNSEVIQSVMVMNAEQQLLPAFNYDFLEKSNNQSYSNKVSLLAPHQHSLSRYPFGNASDLNKMVLGTTYRTSTTLGRKKLTGTYFFDVMGNLVDYQLSISKSKK